MSKTVFVYREKGKFFAVRLSGVFNAKHLGRVLLGLELDGAEEVGGNSFQHACRNAAAIYRTKAVAVAVFCPADEGWPVDPSFREGRLIGISAVPDGMLDAGVFGFVQYPVVRNIPMAHKLIERYANQGARRHYPHEGYMLRVAFRQLIDKDFLGVEKILDFYRRLDAGDRQTEESHRSAIKQVARMSAEGLKNTLERFGREDPDKTLLRAQEADRRYRRILGL